MLFRVSVTFSAALNQLSRFTLSATLRKTGRTVTSVEISWEPKPDPTKIKRELAAAKVGRKARLTSQPNPDLMTRSWYEVGVRLGVFI